MQGIILFAQGFLFKTWVNVPNDAPPPDLVIEKTLLDLFFLGGAAHAAMYLQWHIMEVDMCLPVFYLIKGV